MKALPSKATRATIDIVDSCKNRCIICSRTGTRRLARVLPFESFKSVLEEHPKLERVAIEGGEPFLHSDLVRMLNLCFSKEVPVDISTSATVWREDVVGALKANAGRYKLQIHLPAADAQSYKAFTFNEAWDSVLANAQKFVEMLGREALWIRTTVCKENIGSLPGVAKIAKELGLRLRIGLYLPMKGSRATQLTGSERDSVSLYSAALAQMGVKADFMGFSGTSTKCPVLAARYGFSLIKGACAGENGTEIYVDAGGSVHACEFLRG